MKVLFIWNVIPDEEITVVKGHSVAGNRMQLGILKGLTRHIPGSVSSLTIYPIASYPKEKHIFIKEKQLNVTKHITTHQISFINIFFIKQLMQIINGFLYGFRWARLLSKNDKKIIICYNAMSMTALPTIWVSKLFKCKSVCILADPPIDIQKRGKLGRLVYKIDSIISKRNLKAFDGIVTLNEEAAELYAPGTPYLIIDGGFSLDEDFRSKEKILLSTDDSKTKRIMFAGTLADHNGIRNLLAVFTLIKNTNYRLIIYGSGPLEDYVKKASKEDQRIIYMGMKPNKEVKIAQQNVDLLINPRPVNDMMSRLTFPSKLIEYMLSGTPVITTRLNGITEDYYPYLYFFDEETPEAFAQKITEVLGLDQEERRKKGIAAREYVIKNKNWDVQCRKIVEFIFKEGSH
ncbi:glycosyltransferase [candidate division WWE3 bacterium]|jgi:glycosyltransferase involved in cell wall biosynthesis|uniref:Glycosyltransferase n=1 Tax=candidate division WWE3 bacterium TaxID=2053526 RepID=A0A3A4ZBY0_UNCKA|nr:MAG: glycosyltransferase [candidate division WWE3 bacterium]